MRSGRSSSSSSSDHDADRLLEPDPGPENRAQYRSVGIAVRVATTHVAAVFQVVEHEADARHVERQLVCGGLDTPAASVPLLATVSSLATVSLITNDDGTAIVDGVPVASGGLASSPRGFTVLSGKAVAFRVRNVALLFAIAVAVSLPGSTTFAGGERYCAPRPSSARQLRPARRLQSLAVVHPTGSATGENKAVRVRWRVAARRAKACRTGARRCWSVAGRKFSGTGARVHGSSSQ